MTHGFSAVFSWGEAVIVYMFSVFLSFPFPDHLARESRLMLWLFFFLSELGGGSGLPVH